MRNILLLMAALSPMAYLYPQSPEITSWIVNTSGDTGYNGIPTNVQQVQYSDSNVYVSTNCIPGYDIGPWNNNPNDAVNQNFVFRITRFPQEKMGNKTATPLGHIGVWSNGVSIFNADDGMSYNNANVWNRDAYFWEGSSFDMCLGHPAPNGEYHHHVNPSCLYDSGNGTEHSPIIGYAFDGFPIYGAYGYANTDGTGGIARMETSYRHKMIATRNNGPAVNAQYPLGAFLEDNEYVQGLGDLDEHNGRFCITPEYPNGVYAYFVTLDENGLPAYPYVVGPTYYGAVTAGNTGPQSGHVSPLANETVTTYVPDTTTAIATVPGLNYSLYPNPVNQYLILELPEAVVTMVEIYNAQGQLVLGGPALPGKNTISVKDLPAGLYLVQLTLPNGNATTERIVKQ